MLAIEPLRGLMFDCGEGTQRQMMRYGGGFALSDLFFTHFHADHDLGLVGELRTGETLRRKEYDVEMIGVEHGENALGYALR